MSVGARLVPIAKTHVWQGENWLITTRHRTLKEAIGYVRSLGDALKLNWLLGEEVPRLVHEVTKTASRQAVVPAKIFTVVLSIYSSVCTPGGSNCSSGPAPCTNR